MASHIERASTGKRGSGVKKIPCPNLYVRGRSLYTRNLTAGAVYGEHIAVENGVEYREWSPRRSKLASYLLEGGSLPLRADSRLLYLGAGTGTTASHLSDMLSRGIVFCIEVSPIPFMKLLSLSEIRPNILPVLGDARRPERYRHIVIGAECVYQDISQRDQVEIFARNFEEFGVEWGLLMLKARSISQAPITDVLGRSLASLSRYDLETTDITRYHRHHMAIMVRRRRSALESL